MASRKEVGDHPGSEKLTDVLLSVGSKTYIVILKKLTYDCEKNIIKSCYRCTVHMHQCSS